jgi:N6-L-threonylcarbamoyladenine synthase
MTVLGIETSCDETAAAVVSTTSDSGLPWRIESNVVASQTLHREWGGVVPELASRQHVRDLPGVVDRALEGAAVGWEGIDAIAVTQGPGLVGSLLVGVAFAKAAAAARHLPIVGVHHLAGHIESIVLAHGEMPLPSAVLVVSGGHTSLYLVPEPGRYQLVGKTRDDAAGEAYDKVAKLLGLGYPGGPVIDRLARTGRDTAIDLPKPKFTHPNRVAPAMGLAASLPPAARFVADFSFSGLKTAVIRRLEARGVDTATGLAVPTSAGPLGADEVADFCASFQRVVVESLVERTFEAARWLGAKSVGIAGGVSANSRLRTDAARRGTRDGVPVFVPPLALSTDNAAMIAAAGLRRLARGDVSDLGFAAQASLALS